MRAMQLLAGVVLGTLALGAPLYARAEAAFQVKTSEFDQQVRNFLQREIAAHVADIKSLDPAPDRVEGALTAGEFSWGTFMRAVAADAKLSGSSRIAERNVPEMLGRMARIELERGEKTWAQLYAAMALLDFGADLRQNALWNSLSAEDREAYKKLLDPARFYDAKTHTLIHLPENYFGVAARIAAIDYALGLTTNRAALDDLLDRAAKQFTDGALFADDSLPTGRYDRYSNEYARAMYDAAELAGRNDVAKAIAPSLTVQMKLWWDLLSPDGYGYPWGRSLGAISYMDTMEIAAFLAKHPQFRPAPLPDLAAAYYAAWSWLRHDYSDERHLLSVFAFGRGDYSYITKEREWQQTTAFFGKAINAHEALMGALAKEHIESFPSQPKLPDVARFQFFREGSGGRKFGVWVVRQGGLRFALPFVTGPKAATSDYEPAPHGLEGFAAPVEKIYPCLVPFLELEDGRTIAAADGADEIRPAEDGKSVTAVWRNWVVPGTKTGETVDAGLVSQVTWSIDENELRRAETLTASRPVKVKRLWMAIPSRANHFSLAEASGSKTYYLTGDAGGLDVRTEHSDWPLEISAYATGNDALGRGDRGAVPLHLIVESKDIVLSPGAAKKWEIVLSTRQDEDPFKNLGLRKPPLSQFFVLIHDDGRASGRLHVNCLFLDADGEGFRFFR